jgi:hypothetical protein
VRCGIGLRRAEPRLVRVCRLNWRVRPQPARDGAAAAAKTSGMPDMLPPPHRGLAQAEDDIQSPPVQMVCWHRPFDLQRVTSIQVSCATIRQLALEDLWGPDARRAFVVTFEVAFGLARMFDILTEERGHEIQVFTTMPVARQWLGIP